MNFAKLLSFSDKKEIVVYFKAFKSTSNSAPLISGVRVMKKEIKCFAAGVITTVLVTSAVYATPVGKNITAFL